MEIWLDTIHLEVIQEAALLGLIKGVTTNPAILSHAKEIDKTLKDLLYHQKGTVAVQVTATTHREMIQEGRCLFEFSERFLIKIPVNREGLIAIRQLSQENIPVLGTAVFHPKQAFLAAKLGAAYISPYLAHMANAGIDPFMCLRTIQDIFVAQSLKTKIMVASLKQIDQLIQCAQMGIDAVTLKDDLFKTLIEDHLLSESFTNQFNHLWGDAFSQASIIAAIS